MRGQSAQHGRRHALQAIVAAACVTIGIAVAAGCASRSGLETRTDKSPGGAIQFAATRIVAAKTVHVHVVVSGDVSATVDGSVRLAPTLSGDVTVKADKDADMIPDRAVYDGKTVYIALPKGYHATSKAKPHAAWFAFDMPGGAAKDSNGSKDSKDSMPASVVALLKSDPASFVKEVLAKGKFTQTGKDTADGVDATRFTGEITGDDPAHVDVWLDASGLPVEIVFQSASDRRPKGRTEVHFSQWGTPVTITAPPADQVLTENDEISFAISGQEFKISADQLDGSDLTQGDVIGTATPTGGAHQTCVPVDLPSLPSLPSPAAALPTRTTVCFDLKGLTPPGAVVTMPTGR
ncbi:hypothetical protein [Catenulispora subtropica]|uniref:Lipoprotein n=1 Tax=Catenulispora subtropica TaxID=450798 RepID=A0ABN2RAI1_9ACTN